jgi:hypothetical protein
VSFQYAPQEEAFWHQIIKTGQRLALFIDFENIAIGVRDAHYRSSTSTSAERLLEKGKVLVKKAYADRSRYSTTSGPSTRPSSHRVPQKSVRQELRRWSAWSWTRWTCRSRRSTSTLRGARATRTSRPRLQAKENNKYVIGLGQELTSDLLIENCDEFIFYEDLVRGSSARSRS